MSTTIDQKVVEMRFDNEQFERGVQQSLGTLDKLKNAMNFGTEAASGVLGFGKAIATLPINVVRSAFDAFQLVGGAVANIAKSIIGLPLGIFGSAAEKVGKLGLNIATLPFSAMNKALDEAGTHFSALTAVGLGFYQKIGHAIADFTGQLANMATSMTSIKQMGEGWDKYATKTSAVHTIMAATRKDFEDEEEQMAAVNEQLDKLNWFTDETSYKLTDMVNNIGKFTSNGVKLDTAVTAMQGIATWAGISGATVEEAGRAMYNLSQALGVGAVTAIDWKSVENANMATYEFKEMAIETAIAMGTLHRESDGTIRSLEDTEVSVEKFRDTLSDKWLTSDVLLQTVDRYGSFADALHEAVEDTGLSTAELLDYTDKYVKGSIDMEKVMRETGLSAEKLGPVLAHLADDQYELGRRAFRASQETKTFKESIEYVQEAVSSGWAKSFEYIIGDYQEAKEAWSYFTNKVLYSMFVQIGEVRNEILGFWKDFGGREYLFKSLENVWLGLNSIIEIFVNRYLPAVNSGWTEIFGEKLANGTKKLEQLTAAFRDVFGEIAERFPRAVESSEELGESITEAVGEATTSLEELDEVANRVLNGEFGNGQERIDAIHELGYSYAQVQNRVNELLGVEVRHEETEEDLAATHRLLTDENGNLVASNEAVEETEKNLYERTKDYNEQVDTLRELYENGKISIDEYNQSVDDLNGSYEDVVTSINEARTEAAKHEAFMEKVGNIVTGLADGLELLGKLGKAVWNGLKPVADEYVKLYETIGSIALDVMSALGLAISDVNENADETKGFLGGLTSVITTVLRPLEAIVRKIRTGLEKFRDSFGDLTRKIKNSEGFQKLTKAVGKLWDAISKFFGTKGKGFFEGIGKFIDDFEVPAGFGDGFVNAIDKVSGAIGGFIELITDFVFGKEVSILPSDDDEYSFQKFGDVVEDTTQRVGGVIDKLKDVFKNFGDVAKDVSEKVAGFLGGPVAKFLFGKTIGTNVAGATEDVEDFEGSVESLADKGGGVIGTIIKTVTDAWPKIKEAAGHVKDFITSIFEKDENGKRKGVLGAIQEFITAGEDGSSIIDKFAGVFKFLGEKVEDAKNKIVDFSGAIFGVSTDELKTTSVMEILGKSFEWLSTKATEAQKGITDFFGALNGDGTGDKSSGAYTLGASMTNFLDKSGLKDAWQWLKDNVFTSKGALTLLGSGGLLGLLFGGLSINKVGKDATANMTKISTSVSMLMDAFGSVPKAIAGLASPVTSVLNALTSAINNLARQETPSEKFLKISVALVAIAGALWIVSKMETEKIIPSLIVLGVAVGLLVGVVFLISKIKFPSVASVKKDGEAWALNVSGMFTAILSIMGLASAIILMAASIKQLGSMSRNELIKGFLAITASLILLGGTIAILGKLNKSFTTGTTRFSNFSQVGKAFIGMAAAVWLVGAAVKKFGKMDRGQLDQGFTAVIGILFFMGLATGVAAGLGNKGGNKNAFGKLAGSFLAMAVALDLLIPSILAFGYLPLPNLIQGGAAVVTIMIAMGGLMAVLNKYGQDSWKGALGIVAIALALDMIIPAIATLGALSAIANPLDIAAALAVMVVALGGAVYLASFAKDGLKGAAGILALAVALNLLLIPMMAFAGLGTKMIDGALAIAAVLGTLTLFVILLGKLEPLLEPGIYALNGLGQALLFIAGACALLAIAMLVFTVVGVPGVTAFSVAIMALATVIAAGIVIICEGIATGVMMALATFAMYAPMLQEVLGDKIGTLIALLGIFAAMVLLVKIAADAGWKSIFKMGIILGLLCAAVYAICYALTDLIKVAGNDTTGTMGIMVGMIGIMAVMVVGAMLAKDSMLQFGLGFLAAGAGAYLFAEAVNTVVETVKGLVGWIIDGIKWLGKFFDASSKDKQDSLTTSVASTIIEEAEEVSSAAESVGETAADGYSKGLNKDGGPAAATQGQFSQILSMFTGGGSGNGAMGITQAMSIFTGGMNTEYANGLNLTGITGDNMAGVLSMLTGGGEGGMSLDPAALSGLLGANMSSEYGSALNLDQITGGQLVNMQDLFSTMDPEMVAQLEESGVNLTDAWGGSLNLDGVTGDQADIVQQVLAKMGQTGTGSAADSAGESAAAVNKAWKDEITSPEGPKQVIIDEYDDTVEYMLQKGDEMAAASSSTSSRIADKWDARMLKNYVAQDLGEIQEDFDDLENSSGETMSRTKENTNKILGDILSQFDDTKDKAKVAGKETFEDYYAVGVSEAEDTVTVKVAEVMSATVQKIKDQYNEFKGAGNYSGDGFAEGLREKEGAVYWRGYWMASKAKQGAQDALSIESPSKVFRQIGIYSDEGMIQGLEHFAGKVYDAGAEVGGQALDGVAEAIKNMSDSIDEEVDPVIRPVLDLSDVTKGTATIDDMLNSNRSMRLAGNAALDRASISTLQNGVENELLSSMKKLTAAISGGGNTINVYAQPGMDVKELANEVQKRLTQLEQQRRAVFA